MSTSDASFIVAAFTKEKMIKVVSIVALTGVKYDQNRTT